MEENKPKIPCLLDGEFFSIVSIKDGKVKAKCLNCVNKELSGMLQATSNFLRHLKTEHPPLVKEYEKYRENKLVNLKTRKRKLENASTAAPVFRTHSFSSSSSVLLLQRDVDSLITDYIIGSMSPLYTVEEPAFKALVTGLAPSRRVMTRKTLSERINFKFDCMMDNLRSKLAATDFVCTTADIWSVNNSSFLGMTVHWVTGTLHRGSAAIACQRFEGSHTYNRIAEMISDIHAEYDLDTVKVVSTVTDNASNFRKTFSEYMSNEIENIGYELCDNDDESVDEKEAAMRSELMHVDMDTILSNVSADHSIDHSEGVCPIQLPHHIKCVCHSLNLIVTTDADKAIGNGHYGKYYHTAMGKCQAIWNAVNKSREAADGLKSICNGETLTVPCRTSSNSKYDAIVRLIEQKDKLDKISELLKVPKFTRTEIEFICEYKSTMEPLANTLNSFQSDVDCFLGMLMPKLTQLRNKLTKMQMQNWQFCGALVSALLSGLETRFENFWKLDIADVTVKEATLAAVSHPKYKMKWLSPNQRDKITQLFVNSCSRITASSGVSVGQQQMNEDSDDDYGYNEYAVTTPATSSEQLMIMQYLSDTEVNLEMLHKYDAVKMLFQRCNTTLPSSAPVEKLFSAGVIETVRQKHELTDSMFEKLILLKMNKILL